MLKQSEHILQQIRRFRTIAENYRRFPHIRWRGEQYMQVLLLVKHIYQLIRLR